MKTRCPSTANYRLLRMMLLCSLILTSGNSISTAAHADPLALPPAAGPQLRQGTSLIVSLKTRIKSGEAKAGQAVAYTVAQNVYDGQVIVVAAGTPAFGQVTKSQGAGAFGKPGALQVTCDYLQMPDGSHVPLQNATLATGAGRDASGTAAVSGLLVGGLVGTAAYAGSNFGRNFGSSSSDHSTPAGVGIAVGLASGLLIGSLLHGGDVILTAGQQFTVTVAQDTPLAGSATLGQ